jgi:hypothetical protein
MKILAAIDLLVHGCGYNATRNANLKFHKGVPDESACEVVARALGRARVNISGRGVEKIWERSGRTGTGTRSKKAPELYEIEIKIDSPSDP